MQHTSTLAFLLLFASGATAQQRYLQDVFTDDQLLMTPDVVYGTNIDVLTSNLSDPSVFVPEVMQLQGLVDAQQPIPAAFFDPTDASTAVKVTDLRLDVYGPDPLVDTETERPLVLYIHTGDALPPGINGTPYGSRKDSSAAEVCRRMARRGFMAMSVSYRTGWNPLGTTVEVRRGTLLNAVYRAIHDLKQSIRFVKQNANAFGIDPQKVIVMGEGMGGYIALSLATLDRPEELYIEKFRPDEAVDTVSYIDSTIVGDLHGFNGLLNLYRPNGFDSDIAFCVNMGGALPDTNWLQPGDVPMVSLHTVFNPFTPFGEAVVIVPATGEQVVDVFGSNAFMQQVNAYGNNATFATLPNGDIYTDIARSRYGSTQVHSGGSTTINSNVEGLYPIITNDWPAMVPGTFEEANPWQWWDPNAPISQIVVDPGPPQVTTSDYALASNPAMSAAKGRAMIDTLMGYVPPRIVCALNLGPCSLVGIDESDPIAAGVGVFPNPAHDRLSVSSEKEVIRMYTLYDINGRRMQAANVEATTFLLFRGELRPGAYFLTLQFDQGTVTRKVMLD